MVQKLHFLVQKLIFWVKNLTFLSLNLTFWSKSCILCVFNHFYCALFSLYRSWANRSEFGFCRFARSSWLFFLLSAITPKIKVRSRAKSDWAISKSDVTSSVIWYFKNQHTNQFNIKMCWKKIEIAWFWYISKNWFSVW